MRNDETGQADFYAKYEESRSAHWKRPNILVCGYTGCGKTSLIKAIFGDEIVTDDAIGHGAPATMGYKCYENDLLRVWDSKGMENGISEDDFVKATQQFISEKQSGPVEEHIHLVWYAIQGPGVRVTPCDKNLFSRIFKKDQVIVVVTKNDITESDQRKAIKKGNSSLETPTHI